MVLAIFMPITIITKKVVENARIGKASENDKDGKNNKDREKKEYLKTNFAKISFIRYPIAFQKDLYWCYIIQVIKLMPSTQLWLRN